MGTTVRPELSVKNCYWIERHRYYELKHFCLQYPMWKKAYKALDGLHFGSTNFVIEVKNGSVSDPTAKYAEARVYFKDRMELVERAAEESSPEFGSYILKAVTEGISYEHLKARLGVPCCKDIYYNLYRRFFWLLSKARK